MARRTAARRRGWRRAAAAAGAAALSAALAAVFAPVDVPARAAPAQQATPTPVTLSGTLRRGASPGCPAAAWRLEPCGGGAPVPIGSTGLPLDGYADLEVTLTGRQNSCPGGGAFVDVSGISAHPCAAPTAAPNDPNLALGRPVQVPAGNPDPNGGQVNDGSTATAWRAPGGAVSWLYVDLQSEQSVHKFVFRWGAGHAARYGIYMWDRGNGRGGDWSALYFNPAGRGGDETVVVPLVRAQVFLLYLVTPADAAAGFELREWEVYGRQVTNLARGHHVDASSEQPLYPARHAVDGQDGTAWHGAAARRMTAPTWLRVVYSPLRADISAVRILWDRAFARQYRIHLRADGEWLKAYFPLENDGWEVPNAVSWGTPFSVDEVWVVIDESDVAFDHVGIRELELYAQPPSATLAGALDLRAYLDRQPAATDADAAAALGRDAVAQGARLQVERWASDDPRPLDPIELPAPLQP